MESVSSFISLAEKITLLNKNCVEILTKVNDIVSSKDSSVNIIYDDNGAINSYSMPTVGDLSNQIKILNQNMKRMASIDGYTFIRDGQSFKRVMTTDLNKEPLPVGNIDQVNTFTPINNHFFESLMNPMLAVTIDLTNKVGTEVNKILSRRYILKFEKNVDGTLTESGLRSYNSFVSNFLNKTNINITDFLTWYDNPTNDGIIVDNVKPYDEQIYDLKLKTLNYYGIFSVIKVEIDDINNKMWYHLNDIRYYGNDGTVKTLSISDELIINKLNSASRYRIAEVNTDSSNTKVRLENIEGYDPVVVGTNVLKYYSDMSSEKSVQINVGFDEYTIQFVKPINTDDNIVGNLWSQGISFYTNDLLLDANNNINLANYYVQSVYDYGTLLKDMISKKIPTIFGVTPNVVNLISDNFKVVQINKHLTDNKDQEALKKLHSDKTSIKTKISQLNTAIIQKTSKLNSGGLTTTEKQANLNEINKLKTDLDISTKNLSSFLSQLNEINSGQNNTVVPKYRARGFWRFPEPIITNNTAPQHVVQFRIQYIYSSTSGNANNVQTFNYETNPPVVTTATNNTTNAIAAITINKTANTGKSVPITSVDVSNTTENPTNLSNYANFSNWTEIISDVRKRYWDENSKQWYWKIEDVSNPDIPNINQLDIPIQANERIDVRVKSISEVGWPDSLLESEWSNVLTINFPEDLKDVLDDNEFILKEASQDEIVVSMDNTLNSKGVYKHIEDSFYINQDYFAHIDKSIQTSFKNDQSNSLNLYQYLTSLTDRITKLEEIISNINGILKITILKNLIPIKTITNNTTTNIIVQCEDYGVLLSGSTRTYLNDVYDISDYSVNLENVAQNGNLGFLSSRNYDNTNSFYSSNGGDNKILLIDLNNYLCTQNNNQFIWFADKDNNDWISSGVTITDSLSNAHYYLNNSKYNLGCAEVSGTSTLTSWNINNLSWSGSNTDLLCTAFPYLPDVTGLVENGQDKTKIIKPQTKFSIGLKLFFKFDGSSSNTNNFIVNSSTPNTSKTRKIKFWFETSDNTTYQFNIIFNFSRYKNFLKQTSLVNITSD